MTGDQRYYVDNYWHVEASFVHLLDGLRKAGVDIPDEPAAAD